MNVKIYQIMDWIVLIYCFSSPFVFLHDKTACVATRHNRLRVGQLGVGCFCFAIHGKNSWLALLSFNKTIIQFTYCHL